MQEDVWKQLAKLVGSDPAHRVIGEDDFASLFGIRVENMPSACVEMITRGNFRYIQLTGEVRDSLILQIMQRIDSGDLTKAGQNGKPRWEEGWGENYRNFMKNNFDLDQLVPRYIHPYRPLRLNQDYILAQEPDFELKWYEIYRHWLFVSYLQPFDHIYEFACGPGHNLAALAQLFPKKQIVGLDWAQSSVDIANQLGAAFGWNVIGLPFDFFKPDSQLSIKPNSAVLTIGGLEQTGENFIHFFDYLLSQRPSLVIHIEPFLEWYDEKNMVDYLAARFHKLRRYLRGYIPHLENAQKNGCIHILKKNRSYFGSLYHDGYSLIIWKPI